jgi:hypothetical protein
MKTELTNEVVRLIQNLRLVNKAYTNLAKAVMRSNAKSFQKEGTKGTPKWTPALIKSWCDLVAAMNKAGFGR